MRKYEIMYILKPDLDAEKIKEQVNYVNSIFTDNDSNVLELKEWGMRDLAYEINHYKKGYYVWLFVEANNKAISEFNRLVRINEFIIRDIVVKDEE